MDTDKIYLFATTKTFHLEPKLRKQIKQYYTDLVLEKGAQLAPKTVADFYYGAKIDKDSIMIVGLGTNVCGSMQYVLDELNHNERYSNFKIYIRTKAGKTDEIVKRYIEQNNWSRTETVSKGYYKKLESCKYLLTESTFPYNWVKRPGQVLIDIWHGTPLKRLGLEKNGNNIQSLAIEQKNFLNSDYLLYPNTYTRDIMYESHKIASLLPGKALMLGYPRTAGMLGISDERKKELLEQLAPNGEKIYAYMPTFRGYLSDSDTVARELELLTFWDGQLKDDQILYVNLHHHVKEAFECRNFKHIKKFPPLVDTYQVLVVTDALITDYSSVFFDYLVLGKQIILYINDYAEYTRDRGLNMDIKELPFDITESKEEVIDLLNKGKQYDDSSYRESMCAYDSVQNTEKLCRLFVDDETDLCLERVPHNDKKKVLFYTDSCATGKETVCLEQLVARYDKNKFELYVGCDEYKTEANIINAENLLHNSLVLASIDNTVLSSIGMPLRDLYLKKTISFDEAMQFLIHEYALMPLRMYGNTTFDTLAIYDTLNPEIIIGLALSSAYKKLLFINEPMFREMLNGNRFLKDAVRFAADYCNAVVVQKEAYIPLAESILSDTWKGHISVIGNAESLMNILEADSDLRRNICEYVDERLVKCEVKKGYHLEIKENIVKPGYINKTGKLFAEPSECNEKCSDYISVMQGSEYTLELQYSGNNTSNTGWMCYAFYDKNRKFLSREVIKDTLHESNVMQVSFVVPSNVFYVAVSGRTFGQGKIRLLTGQYDIGLIAHKGYSIEAPENTLSAYRLAKEKGFDWVETDIRFTKDDIPVLSHNDDISIFSDGIGFITEMTYEELQKYDFGIWKSEKYADEKLPAFEEFIDLCKQLDFAKINVHVKTPIKVHQVQILYDIVKKKGMLNRLTWVCNLEACGIIATVDHTSRITYPCVQKDEAKALENIKRFEKIGEGHPLIVHCHYKRLTKNLYCYMREHNIACGVFPVNSNKVLCSLKDEFPEISEVTTDAIYVTEG